MDVLYARCAGLDVHKDSVVACVRIHEEGGAATHVVQRFGTTTTALLALRDWLESHGCTHVAMEATGVYWKPVWHLLEDACVLVLANAMHIKHVPGRKTDVNDATWIADLLAHGLIRASFVPPTPIQDLRTLMRTRKQLVREKVQHVQRIQKTLEDANPTIASVISDGIGVSGRAVLHALIAGETQPEALLAVTRGRLQAPPDPLLDALRGRIRPHHRFLLRLHLDQIGALEQAIATVDAEMGATLAPFRERAARLTTMPGISDVLAQVIVSEIGVDMSRFPTAAHLVSWAGLCPRHDESAGKRRSTRVRQGAPWLKTAMVQAAWAASRAKTGYLRAQFLRLRSRRGPRKAVVAVAASMLTAAYYMLRDDVDDRDLGADHFERTDRSRAARRLVRKLGDLGFHVELTDAA
jgi:transposase